MDKSTEFTFETFESHQNIVYIVALSYDVALIIIGFLIYNDILI